MAVKITNYVCAMLRKNYKTTPPGKRIIYFTQHLYEI